MNRVYAAVEAGGSKFRCAIGSGPDNIIEEIIIPTAGPEDTLGQAADFFRRWEGLPRLSQLPGDPRRGKRSREGVTRELAALGIASFGPVDLRPHSPTYGHTTSTPKPGWAGTDIAGFFADALNVSVGFDTDVNGAAMGEARWGAGQGRDNILYLTVGTGIGGGALSGGRPVHGLMHPEMGHLRVPHDRTRDPFPGCCPYHGDCLEGLACGPAIEKRWGRPGAELADRDEVWDLEAEYLAAGIVNMVLVLSPEIVIIGGGVMGNEGLLPRVRRRAEELLGRYIAVEPLLSRMEEYIVPPGLGDRSGIAGAFVLAARALGDRGI